MEVPVYRGEKPQTNESEAWVPVVCDEVTAAAQALLDWFHAMKPTMVFTDKNGQRAALESAFAHPWQDELPIW